MRTTQRKGDVATAQAIATFTSLGYDVSLPLTESAAYDMIVDTEEGLKRVQVKYCSSSQVDLRRIHSNSNGYVVKDPNVTAFDWLYVYKPNEGEYLIKELKEQLTIKPKEEHKIRKVGGVA